MTTLLIELKNDEGKIIYTAVFSILNADATIVGELMQKAKEQMLAEMEE